MKKIYVGLLVVLILLSTALFYINVNKPIKIALIGNFEEERYSFATSSIIAGRIAENDINTKAGIRGKKTELIIKEDTFDNPEATIKFLLDNKIETVITTAPSQSLVKLKPLLDKNRIVCLAVGSTSGSLSGIDDYIFRILPDDGKEAKAFVDYIEKTEMSKELVLIYDKTNMETKQSIEQKIESLGAKIIYQESWDGDSLSYVPANQDIMRNKPILIISSARHTAFLVQKLRQQGINSKIYGTSWSGDDNLLSYGGRAVEDLTIITPVDLSEEGNKNSELSEKLISYRKGNGLIPNGVYKAYGIIKKAYEDRYEQHITLKAALDKSDSFDKYGDSTDKEYILKIKNGQYTKVGGTSYESAQN
jgi:branched-chain amino acid transport system substrate-binding protein